MSLKSTLHSKPVILKLGGSELLSRKCVNAEKQDSIVISNGSTFDGTSTPKNMPETALATAFSWPEFADDINGKSALTDNVKLTYLEDVNYFERRTNTFHPSQRLRLGCGISSKYTSLAWIAARALG
jgi:hypothetical protein